MIAFKVSGRIMPARDEAHVEVGQDPCVALVEAVVQAIGTDVEVEAGGVALHLAAWQDPDHWASEWKKKGIDDPYEFIEGLNR